ncbi:MAG: hypothetical protein M3082_02035 [Candidatus Dormibacteraeota bacterium]|nr:hypothetical protein [Candidatus Dormibacteraeota bacterium]
MTLRKKLIALVVPTVLAAIAIPVAVVHAQSAAPARSAAVHAQSAAPALMKAVHAKPVTAAATVKTPAKAAAPAETTTEGIDDPLGHTDEIAGSPESSVDHQFDGTE